MGAMVRCVLMTEAQRNELCWHVPVRSLYVCSPLPSPLSKLQLYVRSEASRRPYSQSILSGRPSTDSVGGVDMGSLYSGSDAARAYHR